MPDLIADVEALIRDVPDFPKPGIVFKDITPVLSDPVVFGRLVDWMAMDTEEVDWILGVESRGFIFGAAMVEKMGKGFIPARKKGKLPWKTVSVEYALEYGTACLELHEDCLQAGDRVLIVDDLLATGGTAVATVELVQKLGATVAGCVFAIELGFLPGRKRLEDLGVPVRSLLIY